MCDRFCVTSGYSTTVQVTEYATQALSGWQSMLLNHCLGDRVCFSTTVQVTEYLTQSLSGWHSMLLNHCQGDRVCYSTTVWVTEYATQPLSGWQSIVLNRCPGDRVCLLSMYTRIVSRNKTPRTQARLREELSCLFTVTVGWLLEHFLGELIMYMLGEQL